MRSPRLRVVAGIAATAIVSATASAVALTHDWPFRPGAAEQALGFTLHPPAGSDEPSFGEDGAPYPEYPVACARLADRLGDHVAAREAGDGTDMRLNLAIDTELSLAGQLGCDGEALAAIIAGAIQEHEVARRR